jgi:hypothetical protein
MGKTGDQLRQELDQTREDASQKIDEIQDRVEDATQKVKDTFDVKAQIAERPLVAAGVAVAGGFLLGSVMGGDHQNQHGEKSHQTSQNQQLYPSRQSQESQGGGVMGAVHNAAKSAGLDDTLNAMAASVVGALTDQLKNMASEAIPGFSEKFQQAQQTPGGFSQKTHAVEESDSRYPSSRSGYASDITSTGTATQSTFSG